MLAIASLIAIDLIKISACVTHKPVMSTKVSKGSGVDHDCKRGMLSIVRSRGQDTCSTFTQI